MAFDAFLQAECAQTHSAAFFYTVDTLLPVLGVRMRPLDLDFVRQQFPAFAPQHLGSKIFMENAGGSYMCSQVMQKLEDYYRNCKMQPYHANPIAEDAGQRMDSAYPALARWLNVDADEVFLGPSTSQNTYVLAQAFGQVLQPGDEVIVTNQDHEANSGCWRKLADRGIVIREWQVDSTTGQLHIEQLSSLINSRSRLLCFPHCSNILGGINPVDEICNLAHEHGITTVVDGVSYAGHGLPDVAALKADIYLFSLYKVYGPHQGVMVIRHDTARQLPNQSHFFLHDVREKRLMPAGPDHAQVAACSGVSDYFDALLQHHASESMQVDDASRASALRRLLHDAEVTLIEPLLAFIERHPGVKLVGPATSEQRAPTISMQVVQHKGLDIARQLGEQGVLCGAGHFYSYRLLEAMDIDPEQGVLRLSMVHYNTLDDVERCIIALSNVL